VDTVSVSRTAIRGEEEEEAKFRISSFFENRTFDPASIFWAIKSA